MPLVVLPVARIIAAAEALDQLDPQRELKDDVNQAIRLSAAQNGTDGQITTTPALAARVEELLASPALPAPVDDRSGNGMNNAPPSNESFGTFPLERSADAILDENPSDSYLGD